MRLPLGACLAIFLGISGLGAGSTDTRLVDAAEHRQTDDVLALVKRGIDVNAPQPDGATALHWAAHWNDVPAARTLIKAGANANALNDYGVTPLFLAATNGSADMLDVLLTGGAKASTALPSGETVLMAAVRSGQAAAVKRLLAAGADVNTRQSSKGQSAIMWAADNGSPDIVKALIEGGADIKASSATGFTPLLFAARQGHIEASQLLLAAGADVNENAKDGSTPLLVAAVRGHAPLAMFFLEHGAQPDGHKDAGYTALHWACNEYDATAFTYKGIDPPGEWSSYYGIPDRAAKLKLIHALLDRGANINAQSFKPLPMLAPHNGGGAVIPHVGATPYLTASASGDAEVMKLLLARGADPSIRAKDGYTALMAATEGVVENTVLVTEARRNEAIQVALDAGDDIEATDSRMGWHPIHIAAYSGFHDVIKFLLAKGADLNAKTKPGKNTGYGSSQLQAQTPLGLVEGTLNGIFYERPPTAAFLRTLGAKSEGRFYPHDYEKIEKDNKTASRP